MTSLFPKAEAKPDELPVDPALARLAFLGRHSEDLQTVRLAGIPIALIELPLLDHLTHRAQAIVMASTFILSVAWFYLVRWWFRGRYGRSWIRISVAEDSWTPAMIVGFAASFVILEWIDQLMSSPLRNHSLNVAGLIGISCWLGAVARDRTNLELRRAVYKRCAVLAFACFIPILLLGFTAYARRVEVDCLAAYGAILLGLALFDAWLLRHTFAETRVEGTGTA